MTTVPFNVTALDTSVATSRSAQMQNSPPQLPSTDATAVFYVKLSDMSSVFKFQTDATDLNDLSSSDVKYYVFKKKLVSSIKIKF